MLTIIVHGNTTTYQVGVSERIPASEIIHIYHKEFPHQVRGLPCLNATLDDLKQIADYRVAELMAAKTGACLGIFYERNNQPIAGDFLSEENEDKGEFVQSLEPGMASVSPAGYNVKSVAPTHPNNGFSDFYKAILKQVAASLGVSYAKLMKDYEAVNYSSLREGTLDEAAFYSELQSFLIENWKEIEFRIFLESLALNSDTIKPTVSKDLLHYHNWMCPQRHYFDPTKEIIATERELKLGLKSPLMIMEEDGLDPEEVMKSWALYEALCSKYKLSFNVKGETETPEEDLNNENNQDDALNKARD